MAAEVRVLDSRYRLERQVASDGDGEAWLATDQLLARPVVVKLMRADRIADADVLARFRAEARLASSITHRNLARIFDYNDQIGEQPPFLVMEFVQGESVADRIAAGPLPVSATLDILAQVAAGVDAACQAGLTRPDIAPANVLVTDDGVVKITDFAIGRADEAAADLYSLGALAQDCLRGQTAQVPTAVAALITDLTDSDLGSGPPTAAEVAQRAAALHKQLAPRVPARSWAEAARRLPGRVPAGPGSRAAASTRSSERASSRHPSRRRLLLVPAAAAIVVAAALLVAGQLGRGTSPAQNDIGGGDPTAQVNGAAFRDQPVKVADRRLLRMGFSVRNRWQPSARVPAGLVIAVSPTGRLRLGSVVTVLGSGAARGSARVMTSRHVPGQHRKRKDAPGHSPTGTVSHSPKAGPPPSPKGTPTPSPSPTGTPSPTPTSSPTQSPTGSPAPSGSPSDSGSPPPTDSASPSPEPS